MANYDWKDPYFDQYSDLQDDRYRETKGYPARDDDRYQDRYYPRQGRPVYPYDDTPRNVYYDDRYAPRYDRYYYNDRYYPYDEPRERSSRERDRYYRDERYYGQRPYYPDREIPDDRYERLPREEDDRYPRDRFPSRQEPVQNTYRERADEFIRGYGQSRVAEDTVRQEEQRPAEKTASMSAEQRAEIEDFVLRLLRENDIPVPEDVPTETVKTQVVVEEAAAEPVAAEIPEPVETVPAVQYIPEDIISETVKTVEVIEEIPAEHVVMEIPEQTKTVPAAEYVPEEVPSETEKTVETIEEVATEPAVAEMPEQTETVPAVEYVPEEVTSETEKTVETVEEVVTEPAVAEIPEQTETVPAVEYVPEEVPSETEKNVETIEEAVPEPVAVEEMPDKQDISGGELTDEEPWTAPAAEDVPVVLPVEEPDAAKEKITDIPENDMPAATDEIPEEKQEPEVTAAEPAEQIDTICPEEETVPPETDKDIPAEPEQDTEPEQKEEIPYSDTDTDFVKAVVAAISTDLAEAKARSAVEEIPGNEEPSAEGEEVSMDTDLPLQSSEPGTEEETKTEILPEDLRDAVDDIFTDFSPEDEHEPEGFDLPFDEDELKSIVSEINGEQPEPHEALDFSLESPENAPVTTVPEDDIPAEPEIAEVRECESTAETVEDVPADITAETPAGEEKSGGDELDFIETALDQVSTQIGEEEDNGNGELKEDVDLIELALLDLIAKLKSDTGTEEQSETGEQEISAEQESVETAVGETAMEEPSADAVQNDDNGSGELLEAVSELTQHTEDIPEQAVEETTGIIEEAQPEQAEPAPAAESDAAIGNGDETPKDVIEIPSEETLPAAEEEITIEEAEPELTTQPGIATKEEPETTVDELADTFEFTKISLGEDGNIYTSGGFNFDLGDKNISDNIPGQLKFEGNGIIEEDDGGRLEFVLSEIDSIETSLLKGAVIELFEKQLLNRKQFSKENCFEADSLVSDEVLRFGNSPAVRLFNDISFAIPKGARAAITGSEENSRAALTRTLGTGAGLLSGTVKYAGQELDPRHWASSIMYIDSGDVLIDDMTGTDFLMLCGIPQKTIAGLLSRVGMTGTASKTADKMTDIQKVTILTIAGALSDSVSTIVINLNDIKATEAEETCLTSVGEYMTEIGKTLVMNAFSRHCAASVCDYVIAIDNGSIAYAGDIKGFADAYGDDILTFLCRDEQLQSLRSKLPDFTITSKNGIARLSGSFDRDELERVLNIMLSDGIDLSKVSAEPRNFITATEGM